MNTKILITMLLIGITAVIVKAAPVATSSTSLTVDGVFENSNVVINSRYPRFSWDFVYDSGEIQYSYEFQVGTSSGAADVWSVSRTDSNNYTLYSGPTLSTDTTYYIGVRVADTSSSASSSTWVRSYFHTTQSAVTPTTEALMLFVDWNNPFNPAAGEITKVCYGNNSSNEDLTVRVFSITGEYIVTLAKHLGLKNALYTVSWDGRNTEGKTVASGMYFVNLESGDGKKKTVRVAVVK